VRHRGAEDEAAALDTDHLIDVFAHVGRGQRVDGVLKPYRRKAAW
jgi:hypothetical protein